MYRSGNEGEFETQPAKERATSMLSANMLSVVLGIECSRSYLGREGSG